MVHSGPYFEKGLEYLRKALGDPEADFRDGQWEAIDGVLKHRRQLVVQRTGWGKSMIYFMASRFLREEGRGMTLLISPLLALMRNQVAAAGKVGIRCYTINSNCTKAEKERVKGLVVNREVDLLIVSPERLADESFQTGVLERIADYIGLLVVDEAHCISDWGHAFRPDYKKIGRLLAQLPRNVPVLATTATANSRVIEDVKAQLGEEVDVFRGNLTRESLYLQNIRLDRQEDRLAWLLNAMRTIEGTGVIYTLTIRDAERVSGWLRRNGIVAYAYSGSVMPPADMEKSLRAALETDRAYTAAVALGDKEEICGAYRVFLEEMLLQNRVKALVATSALSMGFDKPDMSFVIHYQRPKSVVDYYQQVGRAGRGVASAYGILLNGAEDDDIARYFIDKAFPEERQVRQVLDLLLSAGGLSIVDLMKRLNLKKGQIEQILKFVLSEVPQPVAKEGPKYYATAIAAGYAIPQDRIARYTSQLNAELRHMDEYVKWEGCLMKFLCHELDSPMEGRTCGHCHRCAPERALPSEATGDLVQAAADYLRKSHIAIVPRAQWAARDMVEGIFDCGPRLAIPDGLRMEPGMALTAYGCGEWGRLVAQGKYKARPPRFDDRLVAACANLYREWSPEPRPEWVAAVPSLRHPDLVRDFAARLAHMLGLRFVPCLFKLHETEEQKLQANSYLQLKNLVGVFGLEGEVPTGPCLLVDDMVDSKWTLTVIAATLRQRGVESVTPLVLADSSVSGE